MGLNLRYDARCALEDIASGTAALHKFASQPECRAELLLRLPELDNLLLRLQAVRQRLAALSEAA
jgi:hypothetical protein